MVRTRKWIATLSFAVLVTILPPTASAQPSHHGGGHDRWNRIASRLMGASNMSTVPVGNYKFDVSYVSNSPNGERLFFFKSPASSPYGQGQQAGSCMSVGLQRNTPSAPFTYIVTVGSQSGATTNLGPQPGSPPFRSLAEAVERCVAWSGVSIDEASAPQAAPPAASVSSESNYDTSQGIWTDPATGLTWTVRDNGSDITHVQAFNYCKNLRLGGHADWHMPFMDHLETLYDPSKPEVVYDASRSAKRIKSPIVFTGWWAWSNAMPGVSQNPVFGFNDKAIILIPSNESRGVRTLCVWWPNGKIPGQ